MLAHTFNRVFRPVATSINADPFCDPERDLLAGLDARSRLGSHDVNDTIDRDSNIGDALLAQSRMRMNAESCDVAALLSHENSSQPSTSTAATMIASGDTFHAGPSQVFWKMPHSGTSSGSRRMSGGDGSQKSVSNSSMRLPTPTTPVHWSSHAVGRSASSPSLLAAPAPLSRTPSSRDYHPSSLGMNSSRSLKYPQESSASDDSDLESQRSLRVDPSLKQLSPIHERVPFPPHRKSSMDSVPRTPDSIRTFDRFTTHSSSHNAFINRPLKRSLSQTSTSTHLSNISFAPPVIPPLDLRPNFQNAVGVQTGPQSPAIMQTPVPRKSRLPAPTLPTVIGSPRQTNLESVPPIMEDGASGDSSSYVTPPTSPKTPPPGLEEHHSLQSLTELRDLFVDPDQLASDKSRGSATETIDTDATQRGNSAAAAPHNAPGIDTELEGDTSRPNSRTELRPQNPVPPSTLSRTPRSSRARSHSHSSDGSSLYEKIEQRWLKGLSFGSARFVHPSMKEARGQMTSASVLFWLGFIAPWCWLIGGWLLSGDRETIETSGPLLPLWHFRRKGKHVAVDNGDGMVAKEEHNYGESGNAPASEKVSGAIDHQRITTTSWYPLVAPSVESLAPTAGRRGWMHRLRKRYASNRDDPWIMRCRLAAVVSGVLLFGGFIVAMVFAAGVRP